MQTDPELTQALKKVNINVQNLPSGLRVRTVFNLLDKSAFGTLLFLVLGIAMGVLAIVHAKGIMALLVGTILGFGVGLVALLAILSQFTDSFTISGSICIIRNRLRTKRLKLTSDHRVRMKTRTEYTQMKSLPGSGSYFRIVELYISDGKDQQLLIDFQTDEDNASEANYAGNGLSAMIKEQIRRL